MDQLAYTYQGNRLQAVDDQITGNQLPRPTGYNGAPASRAGDFQEQGVKLGQEYSYDASGNLTADKNKGITRILYNHLNLPRQVKFGAGADSVVFRYAADGQKVAKLVYQTGKPTPQRTDYLAGFSTRPTRSGSSPTPPGACCAAPARPGRAGAHGHDPRVHGVGPFGQPAPGLPSRPAPHV
ncbi:hypothetical protein ACFQT0_26105 [Hymenobacter humi]|uniref:RHS repeat-associated core domain-containing protein n=1 Tax=Hymenobacter humi TaxID=1411620 RepID=A0ABW2UC37_9BACT